MGVLFDGIKKLPAEHVGMEKELLLQWMAESQMLEKANGSVERYCHPGF